MTYPGTITLSTVHLTHLADLIRAHRAVIGSRWRKLPPAQQALLTLAHLRNGDTYARLTQGSVSGLPRCSATFSRRWICSPPVRRA